MTPVSLPVVPPQPSQAAYGIQDLYLFKVYNRTSFKAAFGQQAPPYDRSLPLKGWFDTSDNPGTYQIEVGNGSSFAILPLAISKDQASKVNLYGDYDYPVWQPATTTTAVMSFFGTTIPFGGASNLCEIADAVALNNAINGPGNPPPQEERSSVDIIWNTETRRQWNVQVAGIWQTARTLLDDMYRRGVGSPGYWDTSNQMRPLWVPAPEPDWSACQVIPTPIRSLLPNEKLKAGPIGMGLYVIRTDGGAA